METIIYIYIAIILIGPIVSMWVNRGIKNYERRLVEKRVQQELIIRRRNVS